jgi:SEC-C motif-containing protein
MTTKDAKELCPCGSELTPQNCCLPLIQGKKKPVTAEQLLRSRYTAFTRGDVDYILNTHHSKTRSDVKREEIEDWSKSSEWLGLKIVQKEGGEEKDNQGSIVFCAGYRADGKVNEHWEQSLFEKEEGEWRFLDARGVQVGPYRRTEPKIGRNDPCPCGSGKKNKKCCAA